MSPALCVTWDNVDLGSTFYWLFPSRSLRLHIWLRSISIIDFKIEINLFEVITSGQSEEVVTISTPWDHQPKSKIELILKMNMQSVPGSWLSRWDIERRGRSSRGYTGAVLHWLASQGYSWDRGGQSAPHRHVLPPLPSAGNLVGVDSMRWGCWALYPSRY